MGFKTHVWKDFLWHSLLLNDPNKPSLENLYEAFNKTWIFRHDQIEDADFWGLAILGKMNLRQSEFQKACGKTILLIENMLNHSLGAK